MSYHLLNKSSSFELFTKSDSESVFVKGFASVEVEDRQGDIVDPLEFNVDTFVNTGTLLRDHKYISDAFGNHVSAGKVIAAEPAEIYKIEEGEMSIKSIRTGEHITELLEEKHPELGVGDRGLFVVAEVVNNLAKSEVESGILNAFSWRGWNSQVKEGQRTRLKSVDLSEISLVHQPVNNQSTYVRIKDTDARVLADKLRITKLKFRNQSYKSITDVKVFLAARDIKPLEIKQSADGYIAILEDVSRYEVAKSVCISGMDCDLIAAPIKDEDEIIATLQGEETETSLGESEMPESQDTSAQTQERRTFRFCAVDEAIIKKLFPNSALSEAVKGATLALEDGEVADVEILSAEISDEEVAALFNTEVPQETPVSETAVETPVEAVAETVEAKVEAPAETQVKSDDLVALFKAYNERQAATEKMLHDLLKDKDR